jgi:hypothetical protein
METFTFSCKNGIYTDTLKSCHSFLVNFPYSLKVDHIISLVFLPVVNMSLQFHMLVANLQDEVEEILTTPDDSLARVKDVTYSAQ